MCTELLPPGVHQIAVNKYCYIISSYVNIYKKFGCTYFLFHVSYILRPLFSHYFIILVLPQHGHGEYHCVKSDLQLF
jgi:hypothetical protein